MFCFWVGAPLGVLTFTAGGACLHRYIELFAGVGGFRIALDALGGRCVFASEVEPESQATYSANFPPDATVTPRARARAAGLHVADGAVVDAGSQRCSDAGCVAALQTLRAPPRLSPDAAQSQRVKLPLAVFREGCRRVE